jgi:hypothetical protein
MRVWDLTTGTAKLELAWERLKNVWNEVSEQWDDENRHHFEEEFLVPLEPKLRRTLDAVSRLEGSLNDADRQVGSRYS